MDVGTGLALFGTARLAERFLGPTADYLGFELQTGVEQGVANLRRVFGKAINKANGNLDRPGRVPPRVLKAVLDEGYFCEDELEAEYLGGVLASSRSGVDRDDRGVTWIAAIARLSTYDIRLHYVLYARWHELAKTLDLSFDTNEDREKAKLCIPLDTYTVVMDLIDTESPFEIALESAQSLIREGLIDLYYEQGLPEHFKAEYGKKVQSPGGFTVQPSLSGATLFEWAHGGPGRFKLGVEGCEVSTAIEDIKNIVLFSQLPSSSRN